MRTIDNVTTSAQYTDAATIAGVERANGGYFTINDHDVFMQLAYGPLGQPVWTDEVHVPTGNGTLYAGTTGVRFRSYAAGSPARVSAGLSSHSEPVFALAAGGQAGGEAVLTPYTAYTPVINAGFGTPPNLGADGFTAGWFTQLSNGLVHTYGQIVFSGAGKNQGSGNYQITLPILPSPDPWDIFGAHLSALNQYVAGGLCTLIDAYGTGPGWLPGMPILLGSTFVDYGKFEIFYNDPAAYPDTNLIGDNRPWNWGTFDGNVIGWNFSYQGAIA